MPSITIKNVPPDLLEQLRERAETDRRSVNQEAIFLLECALGTPSDRERTGRVRAERQAALWERLAGRWASDRPVEEDIDEIYRSRSRGRGVSL